MNSSETPKAPSRPRIGVSACLLGKNVRFDGGHRRDRFVDDRLGRFVDFVPVCPEVESGLPVPRESLRLVGQVQDPRIVAPKSGTDHTERLGSWSRQRVEAIGRLELDGFLLKKGSPSCGVERVRVYPPRDGVAPNPAGTGIFTAALRARHPALPLAEEGWLHDAGLRASFLERVFTHHRLRTEVLEAEGGPSLARLITFHAAHKFLYLAHSPRHYRELGQLVGTAAARPLEDTLEAYTLLAMEALGVRVTRGKQVNVLHHIVGYFKDVLGHDEKDELLALIDEYREGLHESVVPLTLLGHHLRRHQAQGWLARQVYFRPFPLQLATG